MYNGEATVRREAEDFLLDFLMPLRPLQPCIPSRRIYWHRSIVEENTARGDRHGNREAKKPKKLKPKEIGRISTLASLQKKALEGRYRSTAAVARAVYRRDQCGVVRPTSIGQILALGVPTKNSGCGREGVVMKQVCGDKFGRKRDAGVYSFHKANDGMGAGAVWSAARLIQGVKTGAVPAKISGARPSRLATSDFNDGCSAEKLEFNLWRVDVQYESVWAAFGHVHLMQAARRRTYGCSIYTVHLLKMERDEPVP
jgi:hypothetical protein